MSTFVSIGGGGLRFDQPTGRKYNHQSPLKTCRPVTVFSMRKYFGGSVCVTEPLEAYGSGPISPRKMQRPIARKKYKKRAAVFRLCNVSNRNDHALDELNIFRSGKQKKEHVNDVGAFQMKRPRSKREREG
eukprot:RCo027059